jgi:monoamine oxidase
MTPRDADVIVVGAGLAGLTTARELGGAGLDVIVLEARDRIGGRTWTKRGALDGIDLDMGAMSVDWRQPLITAELERYGIAKGEELPFEPPNVWVLGARRQERMLPVPVPELGDLERLLTACNAAGDGYDPDRPTPDDRLSELDVSIAEWVRRLGLGPATDELGYVFGSSLASGEASETSMLLLARQFAAAGGLWPMLSVDYADVEGGTASLVDAIAADLGAEVRLSSPVEAIEVADGEAVAHAAGSTLRADVVVITTPLNALRRIELHPSPEPAVASAIEAGTANVGAKYWALVREAPDDFHALGAVEGIDVAATWKQTPQGALVVAFGRDASSLDGDDPRAVEAALRNYLPGIEVLASTWHDWASDPLTGGTWGGWRPGFATAALPALVGSEPPLVFAGSETAIRWPGFMEGAIESGFRASARVTEATRQASPTVTGGA